MPQPKRAACRRLLSIAMACSIATMATLTGSSASAHSPAGPVAVRTAPNEGARQYLALGDSYTAGEGLGYYEAGTDTATNNCHRSALSYPGLLAASAAPRFANARSVACSGATTLDLFLDSSTDTGQLAQLKALNEQTTTVTVTIGGNDAGFARVLAACLYSPSAHTQTRIDAERKSVVRAEGKELAEAGRGSSLNVAAAARRGKLGCAPVLDPIVSVLIESLSGRPGAPQVPGVVSIPVVLTAIHAIAPNAAILIGGYPKLFGRTPTDPQGCRVSAELPIYLRSSDTDWIRKKAAQLNRVIKVSAASARQEGIDVRYVNTSRAFARHNLCDSKQAWINPLVLSFGPSLVAPGSFHPTVRGHIAAAGAFAGAGRKARA